MKFQARHRKTLRLVELEFPTITEAMNENRHFTNFEEVNY